MNRDGSIFCGDFEDACVIKNSWFGKGNYTHGWVEDDNFVSYIDKSQWTDSFERRPK